MNKKAFSLVELSIVLIIIGLLVASISSASKLVAQAKVRKYARVIENCNEAIFTFRLAYDAVPGDMSNASDFGLGTNGDGDGITDYYTSQEAVQHIWNHLENADLFNKVALGGGYFGGSEDGSGEPGIWRQNSLNIVGSTFQGSLGMTKYSQAQILSLKHTKLDNGSSTSYYGLSALYAYGIDKKIDDGIPGTGNMIAKISLSTVDNEDDCGSSTVYDIVTNSDCIILYDMPSLKNEL